MMWLITRLTIFNTITASRFWSFSVIHKNVHVSTVLTAQSLQFSEDSATTYFRWSGYFLHCFVKCFFQDMPTNFFIEIGSYLTNTKQKISWHIFFWDKVYSNFTMSGWLPLHQLYFKIKHILIAWWRHCMFVTFKTKSSVVSLSACIASLLLQNYTEAIRLHGFAVK